MTLTATAFAFILLVLLIVMSQGMRFRIFIGALCGAAIGGLLTELANALFGGLAHVPTALINAFT